MPANYRILPSRRVVYVCHSDKMSLKDSTAMLERLKADPAIEKGMNTLVDLSRVTGWDQDFAALAQFQARETEFFDNPFQAPLIACFAPTETARAIARIFGRSWDGSDRLVLRIVTSEAQALSVLGLEDDSLAELLKSA